MVSEKKLVTRYYCCGHCFLPEGDLHHSENTEDNHVVECAICKFNGIDKSFSKEVK